MEQENSAAFYRANVDEVVRLFDEDRDSDACREPCLELLKDEYLPLAFRVTLQYLASLTSPNPELDLERALRALERIEEKVSHGEVAHIPWMDKMREEITDCLRDVQNETRLHAQTSGPRSITQNPPAAARSVVEGNTSLGTETASQSATQLPEIATLASEQTTIAVPEDKKEASSPIIHPAVQQMEDDAEMLLPPSSPLGPDAPVPSPARLSRPVSNISHASTAPQRVDDSVLKRSRDDSDSDSGGSGVHESKRARGEGKEGAGE